MLYQLKEKLNRKRFYWAAKEIVATPRVALHDDKVRIVSSVSHKDLYMYLVAIKTFCRFVPYGRVIIMDDGTLTAHDRELLVSQVEPLEFITLDDVPYRGGVKGVRWGILLTMAELAEEYYVIQLDSDTVTLAELPEVVEAIERDRSITLGTMMGTRIEPMSETCEFMKRYENEHVQTVAEQNFDRLADYASLKYTRGNSGLVGFGKGTISRSRAEDFLEKMMHAIGSKWLERGSFQVSSNFVVANAPDALVLPIDKYSYYSPDRDLMMARFLHFIGTYRFVTDAYMTTANEAIRELKDATKG